MRTLLPMLCAALLGAASAQATTLDFTAAGAPTGTIGTALFLQGADLSGTGRFPAFVQITGNDPEHDAYNTTDNNTLDNGNSPTFNHEITIAQLTGKVIGTTAYYSFLLDINESNGTGGQGEDADKYLSLDKLQIYTSTTPNQNTTNVSTLGTLIYDMDAIEDSVVLLNFDLNSGSGRADMELLIPQSLFTGGPYVYLYSSFGGLGSVDPDGLLGAAPFGNYGASDGFEEWALSGVLIPPPPPDPDPAVPEPGSLILLGSGLVAGAAAARRRRQQK